MRDYRVPKNIGGGLIFRSFTQKFLSLKVQTSGTGRIMGTRL